MPEFKDAGHRPHAWHTGEAPTTKISRGPEALKVTLDTWGPWSPEVMNMYLQSNWGEHPMTFTESTIEKQKNAGHLPYVEKCFAGNTLAQILEGISFWFTIDGVCRPATHQIVRTRGAAFMQHGGRDNDWRHRGFSMPETVFRLMDFEAEMVSRRREWEGLKGKDRVDTKLRCYNETLAKVGTLCYTPREVNGGHDGFDALFDYIVERYPEKKDAPTSGSDIRRVVFDCIEHCKRLYSALVDAGVPWQDARRFLPMGMQTYIHGIYNYRVLQQTLANRLELIMDWEYNCVGQLMVRELRIHTPEMVWKGIKSASDKAMKAAFAGLDSWPVDGKYPNASAVCSICGHPETDPGEGNDCSHNFVDPTPRAHRPEQNPFWILTDDALNGGPVEWIPTNGTYPHDNPKAPKAYKPEA